MRRTNRRARPAAGAVVAALVLAGCAGEGPAEDRVEAGPPAVTADVDCAGSGRVQGSGSTAQQNAMKHWIDQYQRACPGVRIAYNPVGSGAGVAQFLRGATAFGGTDSALGDQDVKISRTFCAGGRAIDLPMAGGPVALGYHLPGVHDLVLDAPTLAAIFDSRITVWDHPDIRRLNPGVRLPELAITAVHRSDDSGTTQNLNAYLSGAAGDDWPYEAKKAWQARGGHSAAGSDGVASAVAATQGAIGYVELSFAATRKIDTVRIDTGAAEPVAPSADTASRGIAQAKVVGRGNDMKLEFDHGTSADGAYPIVLVTYEVVCDTGNDPANLPALKSFLAYTAGEEGQKLLPTIHYAPLPESVALRVRRIVATLS
ncbi:phosphate ABC transporter substrate-binding protein PstS [Streptomyces chengbuensis]|uniref:phosphate ABC transporter substrate-binding protein PstS n=1 Tax=Streptomyces TaxID=1883 RepID=UPI0025B36E3A|nr:phosphate ABC transporter substrate-binding protein PstS [Streptomyces sp. HUAS CB01]WJY51614.1 phosphate ABC transporter substrate-binding protein PstS [Streptomyces sp. HUAS CB01]